MPEKQLKIGLS